MSEHGSGRFLRQWEAGIWAILVALNLISHFAMLGERAMSHDEGIHAYNSYTLWQSYDYRHDPPYHGPLLFHLNAFAYLLAGDSDATARAVPAILGVALIAALFFTRRHLGRLGALAAAGLASLSPVLLFYGRYLWSDIYVELFFLVWTLSAFRYLQSGRRSWLWGVTAAMALGFAAKEVSFIFGATIGAFFLVSGLWSRWRRPTGSGERALDLAAWMLALALPFGAPLLGWTIGRDPGAFGTGSIAGRAGLILATAGLAGGIAWLRFRRTPSAGNRPGERPAFTTWALHFAAFWTFELTLFTTLWTNLPQGVFSGVLGSLGYWLSQQEVARGSQPAYYYLLLALLYETLALALFVAGGAALARRLRNGGGGASLPGSRLAFPVFCVWWGVASWIGYSWAGERMPWLLVHIVFPMTLVGGWTLARLGRGLPRRGRLTARAMVVLGGAAPVAAATAMALLAASATSAIATAWSARWLAGIAPALLLAGWLYHAARERRTVPRGAAWRLVALGAVATLGLLTLRSSLRANFVNYDLATEPMVYAHGTPDIKRALAEIEELTARLASGAGTEAGESETAFEVAFDDEVSWPMVWYLRHQPQSRFAPDLRQISAASPVVLVGKKHFQEAEVILGASHVRRDYRLIWWPHEGYQDLTVARLLGILSDPADLGWLYGVVAHREYAGLTLEDWNPRSEFRLYIERDLVARAWPLGFEALVQAAKEVSLASKPAADGGSTRWCEAEAVIAGPFAGRTLAAPAGVAALPGGGVAIADVGNHRIVVVNSDGTLRRVVGSACELQRGASGGCLDPDGSDGPQRLGDGQFWQPWGIAVSARGEMAVADTWNGRVQLFDSAGRFLWSWGRSAFAASAGSTESDADRLFGPRAVAFDPAGERLVVADTGNKRLLELSSAGGLLQEMLTPGSELGGFAEPIGLAFRAEDGALLVADTWNQRLLAADSTLGGWRIAVPKLWPRKTGATTPYLAATGAASVLLSDPDRDRLLIAGSGQGGGEGSGEPKAIVVILARSGEVALVDPVGVAVAADDRVWVTSRRDGTLWRLPPLDSCEPWSPSAP